MILKYRSGEEIKKGDRVQFHGEPGRIEFVAVEPGDTETDWIVQACGGGVMILGSFSGRALIPAAHIHDYEDLEFVSRADRP
jgi:hypothetical protein